MSQSSRVVPPVLAYAWNNSRSSGLRALRRHTEGALTRPHGTMSTVQDDRPRFAYLGLPQGHANILQLFEERRARPDDAEIRREPLTTTWNDMRRGRWPDVDLVLVGAEQQRIQQLPPERSIVAPFRVHLVIYPSSPTRSAGWGVSKREREQFRRARREHGWELREDASPEAFDFFYRRMHRPTMNLRHAERTRTESYRTAREAVLARGTLVFVEQEGERVSGALCSWSDAGATLTTRLLGVLDGDDKHYATGAFKALYHLLLEWATEHGVRRLDLYGTEALLSKGIFQWKRKLGTFVEYPPNHFSTKRLYLQVVRDTPATRDFLVANPLLVDAGKNALRPVYFFDDDRAAATTVSSRCPNLPGPHLVHLDEFLRRAG